MRKAVSKAVDELRTDKNKTIAYNIYTFMKNGTTEQDAWNLITRFFTGMLCKPAYFSVCSEDKGIITGAKKYYFKQVDRTKFSDIMRQEIFGKGYIVHLQGNMIHEDVPATVNIYFNPTRAGKGYLVETIIHVKIFNEKDFNLDMVRRICSFGYMNLVKTCICHTGGASDKIVRGIRFCETEKKPPVEPTKAKLDTIERHIAGIFEEDE